MPKISLLPADDTLTGAELVVIVQSGETRQSTVLDILDTPRTASATNARWINYNYNPSGYSEVTATQDIEITV